MTDVSTRIEAIAETAAQWRDANHPPRQSAVEKTIAAPNRWTEQALDHALDRWMQRLTVEALEQWIGTDASPSHRVIGVLHGEEGPLAGLRDAVSVWGLGHDYVGAVPASSPALVPAFARDLRERVSPASITFASIADTLAQAEIVLADPIERLDDSVEALCRDNNIASDCCHLRSSQYSVGLVDGHETDDEMGRLAEDMLLYEGKGRRRLALLWAPEEHTPDLYLEAMAGFRGLFPAHEDTPGALQMQQAFLDAQDQPHAYAEGLEFLVSRGEPALQKPAHIRWSEYETLDTVDEWWKEHRDEVYAVIARPHLHDQCPDHWPLRSPGGVHIPPLDDDDGQATVAFLRGLDGGERTGNA